MFYIDALKYQILYPNTKATTQLVRERTTLVLDLLSGSKLVRSRGFRIVHDNIIF